jgi:phosphohistidine phosphatase
MDLIIWRHAEAEDGNIDFTRKLTDKGRIHARRVAAWLEMNLPKDARVLASPAKRAQQTVKALDWAYETCDLLAGASAQDVLDLAGWPNGKRTIVIVGHQPTLGQVAALLTQGVVADMAIKKGAAWWFESREKNNRYETRLRAVVSPDLLPDV